jgi:hypothetical protein
MTYIITESRQPWQLIPHGAATFCKTQNYMQKQSYGQHKYWNITNIVQHDPQHFTGLYQGQTQSISWEVLETPVKRLTAINCLHHPQSHHNWLFLTMPCKHTQLTLLTFEFHWLCCHTPLSSFKVYHSIHGKLVRDTVTSWPSYVYCNTD